MYRFGFNGQEKVNEIAGIGNWNTAEFWEYNTRTGIRANPDPVTNPSVSPYAVFEGNPIWKNDVKGNTPDPSTHTDESGNVVAVKEDGDKGVYKHKGDGAEALKEIDEKYNEKNTAAGGQKIGETEYKDEFLFPQTNDVKNEYGVGNTIRFGDSWDKVISDRINKAMGMTSMTIAKESSNGGIFSLQDQPDLVGQGRLFGGKYYSTESMGNYLAGYNAYSTPISYDGFQRIAGALHQKTHGQPQIKLGTWEKIQLATGAKHYGTPPLFGEVMQQYRMSKKGWRDAKIDASKTHVVK